MDSQRERARERNAVKARRGQIHNVQYANMPQAHMTCLAKRINLILIMSPIDFSCTIQGQNSLGKQNRNASVSVHLASRAAFVRMVDALRIVCRGQQTSTCPRKFSLPFRDDDRILQNNKPPVIICLLLFFRQLSRALCAHTARAATLMCKVACEKAREGCSLVGSGSRHGSKFLENRRHAGRQNGVSKT